MEELAKKYSQILERSFLTDFKIFLFSSFLKGEGEYIDNLLERYEKFEIEKDTIYLYRKAKQLAKSSDLIPSTNYRVGEFDECLKKWFLMNKESIINLKEIYKNLKFINENNFKIFYESTPKNCFYCGITVQKIDDLIIKDKINTKRLFSRGRKLEIDKKDPNGKYEKGNMAFCCYWCNNAKSDEFTDKEFEPIGNVIKEIWKKRF
jgi:deoxyadenosine/deoxycytidine kinase